MNANKKKYDVVVIGAGPGGYVAAIKASQANKKVALIEKGNLGGVCLNVGCIPTKTLLAGSDVLNKILHAQDFGITIENVTFNFAKMKQRKDSVVENLRKGLDGLLRANKIDILRGIAKFENPTTIKVSGDTSLLVEAKSIIIATGSKPADMKAFPCDGKYIHNSTTILDLEKLPSSIAIIGGGYIGCEFASLYAQLGVKVMILEALPSIVEAQGKTISQTLTEAFKKQGIEVKTQAMVQGIEVKNNQVHIHLSEGAEIQADLALVAVGRRLNSDKLDLQKAGVITDKRGAIVVNKHMETNVSQIYAIGDVTGDWLLAHVASHQAIVAAINATGGHSEMHYHAVPAVIFTTPEIAMVGMNLEQAEKEGYSPNVGTFPFQALGKAQAANQTEGFSQIISDKKTGQLLGAQIIGHDASSLIGEMALAIQNELTLDCIIDTIHAHPTVAEAWLEAALIANETPIHFPPKVKK